MARINLGKVVPEKGIDYFTEADKTELKEEIKQEIDAQGMAQAITELQLGSGHSIELELNSQTYQLTLTLKNAAGNVLGTPQTIDLPNENAITNIEYNDGNLVLTKQSGATSQVDITGLIEGLVTESDFNTFTQELEQTLQGINETIGAINVKNLAQDEAIAENYKVINKLNEKLENQQKVINQLPQVTGQGTEVTLQDTIEAQFTIFDVEGNSTQETTTGKNLANIHVITNLSNQFLSRQIVGDTIVLSNNTNSSGYLPTEKNLNEICPNLKVDDIVKLSFKTTSTTAQPTNAIYLNGINQLWRINEVKTITQEMLDSKVILYGGYNETAVISEFMIRLSSITDDTYEKYTNGASPNPSYEQPIYSAGDNENYLKEKWEQGAYSGSNGVGKIDSNQYVRSKEFSTIEPNKEYTSKCVVNGVEYIQGNIFFYKEDESFISSITNISSTFTTPENAKKVKYNIFKSSGITPEDVDYAKLEKGNKASGYSPFGMGSINEKIQNKNLFDKNSNFKTYNASVTPIDTGIKVENNDGGTYRSVWCEIGKDELLGKTLTIQTSISTYNGAIPRIMVVFNNETAQYIENIKTITDTTDGTIVNIPNSFPENADRVSLIFYCSFGSATPTGSYVEYKNLQVELGSTATPYISHEEQNYSIFVQQPMRSIGDVRDKFVKKDGNWFERHYIGEKILNGTENWGISGNQNYFYYVNNDFPTIPGTGGVLPDMKCNYYQISTYNHLYNANDDYGVTLAINNNHFLVLRNKDITTIAELKTWLSTHNVVVQYELETPLDLPCTETQIQQLENLPSIYKEMTIINSEDETPAYLEVSGIYDMNKLITRVEVIESES